MRFSLVLLSLLGSLAMCHADAVRLQINGPDGKPIAGANVRVVEQKGAWYQHNFLPARDFVSDTNGVVSLDSQGALLAEGDKTKPLDASKNSLQARVLAPGLALGVLRLKAGDNTLDLVPGQTLSGLALGEDEKPVPNAHLLLTSVPAQKDSTSSLADALALEAVSDAQGKWTFDSLPRAGRIILSVKDARFKRESFDLDLAQKTPPLFLSPGITLKGRLLKPDGTGAAGVKVYAGDFEHQPVTDANGRFEAIGIAESSVALQIVERDQKLPFLVNYKSVEGLTPGEVRDIGDWQTIAGVHLKGTVVNKATHKPIEGATISTWGRGSSSDNQSDKSGAFDVLVSPDLSGLSARAAGFVSLSRMNVPDPKNGVIDVGTLELQTGKKVTGVLVDEAGHPVTGSRLYASSSNGNREYAWASPVDGSFTFEGMEAGNYTLGVTGYDIVSGAKFSVGEGTTPALRVVLKGQVGQAGPQVLHSIEGRVVDGEGAPVAGAKISLRVQDGAGSYSSPNALSQSDGTFKAVNSMSNGTLRVLSIVRPGFARGAEKSESKDGNWRLDLTLQKKGSALKGRVLDAEGHPVTRAFVALQNGSELPVATDENGAFSLPDAPQTGVTLLASNGPSLASFALQGGKEPVEITLPAVEPIEDKGALADQLLAQGLLGYEWEERWDTLGWKRIEEAFLRSREHNPGAWSWTWQGYLEALGQHEPQTLLAREAELRAQTPADVIPELDALEMAARAGSGDEAQREQARAWLAAQEQEKRDISSGTVTRLLRLALVGARLDEKTGAMWLDYAVQVAGQLDTKGAGDYAWSWAPLAARVSPMAPLLLAQDLSSTAQLQFLASAMQTWKKDNNGEAARQGWEKMQELAADAAQHPDPQVQVEGFRQKPSDLLNQGRSAYAEVVAVTDPRAALALIGPLEEYQKAQALQVIARQAIQQKRYEVAREAVVALSQVPLGNVEFLASAASLAQKFDEPLATQLWPKAYAKARPGDEVRVGWTPSLASYAQERATKWPGESRILLEREWTKRLTQVGKPDADDDFDQNGRSMQDLAEAMAHLNPRRAMEMAEQVPEKENLRAETRSSIATVLLQK